MARSSSLVCATCGGRYRPGGFGRHAASKAHNNARARRAASSGGIRSAAQERRRAAGRRARLSEDRYWEANAVRVRQHKRSRPNDGAAKVVKVRRSYRKPPAVYSTVEPGIKGGRPYRVLRELATGDVIRVWYAAPERKGRRR